MSHSREEVLAEDAEAAEQQKLARERFDKNRDVIECYAVAEHNYAFQTLKHVEVPKKVDLGIDFGDDKIGEESNGEGKNG